MKNTLATAIALFGGLMLVLPITALAEEEPAAPPPCQGKMALGLIKSACKKGGQPHAKKVMKGFVKRQKKKRKNAGVKGFRLTCKTCHTKVGGAYPITADAVAKFNEIRKWKPPAPAAPPGGSHNPGVMNFFMTLFH